MAAERESLLQSGANFNYPLQSLLGLGQIFPHPFSDATAAQFQDRASEQFRLAMLNQQQALPRFDFLNPNLFGLQGSATQRQPGLEAIFSSPKTSTSPKPQRSLLFLSCFDKRVIRFFFTSEMAKEVWLKILGTLSVGVSAAAVYFYCEYLKDLHPEWYL